MAVIAMKVLFVTSGAIACNVSSGNTFLNLFGELADTELYSLFTRSELPDKKIKAAFRIAEAAVIPKFLKQLMHGEMPTINGDIKHSNADISKPRKLLGYDPDYSFRDGTKLAIEWYKENL